ncbi:F-actin-capping protein subunit beta [Plecturocebus cupreus]
MEATCLPGQTSEGSPTEGLGPDLEAVSLGWGQPACRPLPGGFSQHLLLFLLCHPRLEYCGADTAHCSLNLPGSNNPPTLASLVAGTTVETGSCFVAQTGLELLSSNGISLCRTGYRVMAQSRLTATSTFQIQAILLPQPPETSACTLPTRDQYQAHTHLNLLGHPGDQVPSLCEDLLSSVDQPLKIARDKVVGKDYLLCDYNRDGDSYSFLICETEVIFVYYTECLLKEVRRTVGGKERTGRQGRLSQKRELEDEKVQPWLGAMAHAYNPITLGG